MLNLEGHKRYWLYSHPVNMRKSFNGLSGLVNNEMGRNLREGDVFIFLNGNRNKMKILVHEEGCMVIYAVSLDMGRMKRPGSSESSDISSSLDYGDVVSLVRSAIDSPYVRRMKMLSKTL
jgi:IS66 Orf2 like protein.